ncbi:MAG: DUF2142 domain-containing protein [Lachnospiraceae bacterium]|nr:DUF2142 domain-containing protein [Lachnospiraceae bacterium]
MNKKKIIVNLFVFIVLAGILTSITVFYNTDILRRTSYELTHTENKETISNLVDGMQVKQSFVCTSDNLSKFDIVFDNELKETSCIVNMELYNKTKKESVQTWRIQSDLIPHNQYFTLSLDKMEENVLNHEYEIILSTEGASKNTKLSIYVTDEDLYQNGECTINNLSTGKDLCFSLTYPGKINFFEIHALVNVFTIFIIISLELLIVLAVIVRRKKIKDVLLSFIQNIKREKRLYVIFLICNLIGSFLLEMLIAYIVIGKENTLGEYFNWRRYIYILAACFVIEELYLFMRKKIEKIENLFLVLMFTIGILMISTQPFIAGVNWDGQIHYERVLQYSGLTKVSYTQADEDMILINYGIEHDLSKLKSNFAFSSKYANSKVMEKPKQYTIIFQSISYLPTAMTHKAATMLHLPFWLNFSLGRIVNFLLYTYLLYKSICKLKYGKILCMVIGMLPTSLFLATNYGYDQWVTGFSILGVAYLFGEMQEKEKKISMKSMVVILLSFLIGLSAKAIYFPLLGLCLMIKKEKFTSKKVCCIFKISAICVVGMLMASFLLPMLFAGGAGSGDARGGSDVNSAAQISYILSNPWEYTKILLRFIFVEYVNPYFSSGYTNAMAYLGTGSIGAISFLTMIISIFADRNQEEREILQAKNRVWTFLIIFGTICLVATALYVSFTPVGYHTVNGCQYRYLIPILFPLLYFFHVNKIGEIVSKKIDKNKLAVITLLLSLIPLFWTYGEVWIGKLY